MSTLLIQGGRLIDPVNQIDEIRDLYIVKGHFVSASDWDGYPHQIVHAEGKLVVPGLIDCHVCFREPGSEEDETIGSGAAAALKGGFTTVACLPDTVPAVDNRAAAEFVIRQAERARTCRVIPLGSVTKGHKGEELAEIGQLHAGGAVGYSDGKRPITNAEIMRRALQYTTIWDKPILHHAQVADLVQGGIMHEGFQSTILGLSGMPAAAEEIMVRRDIALTEASQGRLHLMTISSLRSVEEIRHAKARGIRVSADVSPHHLLLTDESLSNYDTNFKVDPPLRTEEHRQALIEGLRDNTIEVISSDHQPYSQEKKSLEIDRAPFGISGLETLLPICVEALIKPGHLTWPQLISKLTAGPARLLDLPAGQLTPGYPADVTIIDPHAQWTIDSSKFRSRSQNTPFHGRNVQGKVEATIVSGELRYEAHD